MRARSLQILAGVVVRLVWLLAAALVVLPASIACAAEQQRLDPAAYPRIVNGLTTHDHPAVGALLRGDLSAPTEHLPITADNAALYCSGTLIGCRTFLTAGHCIDRAPFGPPEIDVLPDEAWVYLQHAGLFTVTSIAQHPDFAYPVADLAVLKLGAPVAGIEPAALNAIDPNPFIPAAGTVVGFGRAGGLDYLGDPTTLDLGIKRTGRVETTACLPFTPNPDSQLVCFDLLDPIGPAGDDSAICHGDSGGPLFLDLGSGPVVAGVTSGLTMRSCLPPVHDYDANVYTYRDFILAQLGDDETSTCGGLPPVGDPAVEVIGFDGRLDDVTLSATHTVGVGNGRNSARFALNAIETFAPTLGSPHRLFDVDMYVKAGPGASPTDFDCKAGGTSVFGACVFDLPVAETYSVFVQRVSGAGDYQITATIFGGAPPECGDGVLAFNEQCDDGNRDPFDGCTNNCTTVCGDGIVTPPEECDGGGNCDAQCRQQRVVGDGTPQSCTEAKFDAALAERSVIFDCGPDPVTITLTSEKAITADTTIDGGGRITLSGGDAVRIFTVDESAVLDVRNLTISDGRGHGAGAIYNNGTLALTNCTLSGNSTTNGGGGISACSGFLGVCFGGGIANYGTLTLTNCTLSGNSGGAGGGIFNLGTLTLTNCTLSGNSATDGGGIGGIGGFGTTTLRSTIVANSLSGGDCTAAEITDGGHNLQFPGTSCGETIPSLDPLLDPDGLQDNGGPTQTIALLPGSPAIDAGDPEICANAPVNGVDQRGYARPGAGHTNCSIGAYGAAATPLETCAGDCNHDDHVTINELIVGVNIALGHQPLTNCPEFDRNALDGVEISELVTAVRNAMNGCGESGQGPKKERQA